ncbi:alanine racemase [Sphingomonas sp. RP10(2022)]|uniref:Alanine racemase n=2 Tax=Sphingomonas liriopis TaxID=2949094 RepID=A0A9X2HUW8_9SPHN|nr:alanine racemase [Sphingomonas liriopis]
MRDFLALTGTAIAPHGKTTMAPFIYDLQIADGAWGITVSTPHQIRVARHFGHRRIFVANQIVGRAAIDQVFRALAEDADLDLYCIADSVENVAQLVAGGERAGARRPMGVLVELGLAGGRTGCRTHEEAMAVARAIAASPHLALRGVEGFEGIVWGAPADQRTAIVETFMDRIAAVAGACDAEGLFADGTVLLTAGGTAYFDMVADELSRVRIGAPTCILLRSGCYITHDSVVYEKSLELLAGRSPTAAGLGPMEHALEVWAYVQSRPEPTRIIAALGKRDASYDDLPVPLSWHRPDGRAGTVPAPMPADHRVVALNDQHAFLDVPSDSPLAVGDMVAFGISHPCLTFDKWRVLYRTDDAYDVIGAIRTYF